MKKIFVIGFNKTGTTSIHYLLKMMGINSTQDTQDVLNHIEKYDAFADGDHYHFDKYYEKYPDGLFILNTRPIRTWLLSRYKHARSRNFKRSWCWPVSTERTNQWIQSRERHYQNVWDFFQTRPKQLFIINIEKEGWESALLQFIGINAHWNPNVHKNIRPERIINPDIMSQIKENVEDCLKRQKYSGAEVFLQNVSLDMFQTHI